MALHPVSSGVTQAIVSVSRRDYKTNICSTWRLDAKHQLLPLLALSRTRSCQWSHFVTLLPELPALWVNNALVAACGGCQVSVVTAATPASPSASAFRWGGWPLWAASWKMSVWCKLLAISICDGIFYGQTPGRRLRVVAWSLVHVCEWWTFFIYMCAVDNYLHLLPFHLHFLNSHHCLLMFTLYLWTWLIITPQTVYPANRQSTKQIKGLTFLPVRIWMNPLKDFSVNQTAESVPQLTPPKNFRFFVCTVRSAKSPPGCLGPITERVSGFDCWIMKAVFREPGEERPIQS